MIIYVDDQLNYGFSPNKLTDSELRTILVKSIITSHSLEKNQLLEKLNSLAVDNFYLKARCTHAINSIDTIKTSALSDLLSTRDEDLTSFDTVMRFSSLENRAISLDAEKSIISECIDQYAGEIRYAAVSKGFLVDVEYILAYDNSMQWINSGADPLDVPLSVSVWATVTGNTAEYAAQDIINTRNHFNLLLEKVREVRLLGKLAISKCSVVQQARDKLTEIVVELNSIKALF